MAWMDNIKTWTGLSVEESVRMTEVRDKWRKYAHAMVWPNLRSRTANEQNSGKGCKLPVTLAGDPPIPECSSLSEQERC